MRLEPADEALEAPKPGGKAEDAGEGAPDVPATCEGGSDRAAPSRSAGNQAVPAVEGYLSRKSGKQAAAARETSPPAAESSTATHVEAVPLEEPAAAAASGTGPPVEGGFAGRVAEAAAVLGEEPAVVAALLQCPGKDAPSTLRNELGVPLHCCRMCPHCH